MMLMLMFMMLEMEMESHGGHRLSTEKINCLILAAWTPECFQRASVRTRWVNKLRHAGASHRRMGRRADSACCDHWLLLLLKKKNLTAFLASCISSFRLSMLFFSVSFQTLFQLYLSSLRKGRAHPLCVIFVRGSVVDGVLLLDKMVIDRLNEAAIKLTSAVGPAESLVLRPFKKNVRVIFAQGAVQKKKLCPSHRERTRQSFVPPYATAIQI